MSKKRSDYVVIPRETLELLYYEQGLDSNQIAKQLGVSARTILNRMREYGMERRGHWDYLYFDIPKEELYRLYVDEQLTAPAIAKRYGVSTNVVYRRMEEHGIEVRKGGWDKIKRIVPPEKLEWSPEFAYVVGLIASDGNLRTGVNEVKFYSTDKELADHYCRALGLRPDHTSSEEWSTPNAIAVHVYNDVRLKQYKPQYHVVFSDYAYRARLEEIGLTPNKSNTLQPLTIPDEYFRDFLRGVFDGDGCWHISNRKHFIAVITSGSSAFREWIINKIWSHTSIRTGTTQGIEIRFNGVAAEELGRFLYYQPDLLTLNRKKSIWIEWIKYRYN